jgi:acetyl-CoA C-acetyltransferase
MSNVPHYLLNGRNGFKLGHQQLIDGMIHDGLWDVYKNVHMGETAEMVADKYQVSRQQMDEWALLSHQRAVASTEQGLFREEIVAVDVPAGRGEVKPFTMDESPRKDTSLELLGRLKPVFRKEGRVTAGNAPGTNDGAAAMVLASESYARSHKLPVLGTIIAQTTAGLAPEWVLMTPEPAIRRLLDKAGWRPAEVDLYEINEAFAVQQVVLANVLEIPRERHNVRGGAVALGHPIGASGARCLVTLLHALRGSGKRRGVASLCLGGGNAVAVAIEAA